MQVGSVPIGTWIWAGLIVTMGVAIVERWDYRIAGILAMVILLAAFFRYPSALDQISLILKQVTTSTRSD